MVDYRGFMGDSFWRNGSKGELQVSYRGSTYTLGDLWGIFRFFWVDYGWCIGFTDYRCFFRGVLQVF